MVWIDWLKEVAGLITALGIIGGFGNKLVLKPMMERFERRRNDERDFLAKRSEDRHEEMMETWSNNMQPYYEEVSTHTEKIGRVETTIYDHNDRIINIEEKVFPEGSERT